MAGWPGDPLALSPRVGPVPPAASLAGAGLQKALAARPHSLQPPEPPRLSPDHNVTVPPLSSGTLGPWRLLSCSALATSQPWLWLGPPAPLPPGCCHCLLRCAAWVLTLLPTCFPAPSSLPAPGHARPPLSASLRSSERSQLSGNSNFTFRPGGRGASVTFPTLQQVSASPRPHTALGAGARPQGRRQPWAQPARWRRSAWSTAQAEAKWVGAVAANACALMAAVTSWASRPFLPLRLLGAIRWAFPMWGTPPRQDSQA